MKFNENHIIKSNKQDSPKLFLDQKGQVSIFLAVITTIVITLVAFVINVGLFVKAKINLQNAVDAGAWSGAAAQARRLSGIAYLNWEMRNTYKEWMFKYYVLGQYANTKTGDGSGPNMDFRLKKFDPADASFDQYVFTLVVHIIFVTSIQFLVFQDLRSRAFQMFQKTSRRPLIVLLVKNQRTV